MTRRIDGWRAGGWVFLALLLLFATLPMAWMLLTSVKTQFAASQYPPEWWPHNPTLGNYTRLLSPTSDVGQEFLTYLLNSVWVSSATTVLGVIVAVPAAYAFSRFRFPGREMLFYTVLVRNMFPGVVLLIPLVRWSRATPARTVLLVVTQCALVAYESRVAGFEHSAWSAAALSIPAFVLAAAALLTLAHERGVGASAA